MLRKMSFGEIAAAWVCCGGLALGAFLVNSGGGRDDPATAFYAGAHIPGGGQRSRGTDAEDEPDGHPAAGIGTFPSDAETIVISSAEASTTAEPVGGPKLAAHCRYILRQSLVRYSAAVARLAEAGAGSAVRDASQ